MLTVLPRMRPFVRDRLSGDIQVPLKYWYQKLRRRGEHELDLLDNLIRRGDHVVDVGGNRGAYAYPLWQLGARLEIFEPHPLCFATLHDWARTKQDVLVYNVALSSHAGQTELHVPVDADGVEHSASASIEYAVAGHASRDHVVRTETLDGYGFTDITFVKIDVEGHEDSVISGATDTINASHPTLLVEIEQRHHQRAIADIFNHVLGLGYRGFFLADDRLSPLARFTVEEHQSPARFAQHKRLYRNNFLFLSEQRIAAGDFAALFAKWGGA